jgi:hypothetical protein
MTRLLFFILFSSTAFAQVTVSIDKFDAPNSFYTSFTQGSGSTNLSANNIDYVSGAASLQINYTFNAGSNYFFTVLKNYSTTVKDWSFNTTGFSLRHKGGNNQSILKFRLWEDINRNGSNDNEDEVYMCSTAINAGSSTWVTSNFDLANFIKITGNGNGILDLNRIRAWDIVIENSGINASNGIILLDELLLNSSYTAPADNGAKLSGSFVQLWNSAGCACGQWTTQQWKDEFQKMKDACMTTFVVQYSVYNDLSWYSPSNISNVLYKENALNNVSSI